jgi:hypothetical protein
MQIDNNRFPLAVMLFCTLWLTLTACGGGGGDSDDGDGGGGTPSGEYVVLAWNDLGMHCLNPTYDRLVILPPYNTLWAQVIERGNPPRIVTDGVQVSYSILNNTTSLDKLFYHQFWEPDVLALFGASGLVPDTGLNLHDPDIHNGLSGTMQPVGDHFQADGIPVTPVLDGTSTKDPYQIAQITVRTSGGTTLVQTRAMVPTSDEINCGRCHAAGGTISETFDHILASHEEDVGNTPVLCASCHGSPVLGATNAGSSGHYLSEVIHGFHAGQTAPGGGAITCYDCHPGNQTRCNRSLRHTASDGDCIACHGQMSEVSATIQGGRVPWVTEPKCVACHAGVQGVDTGTTLYRNDTGHGGLYCAACHQSPHAMIPSREDTDNYQALQYQNAAVTIGSCAACHDSSRGEDEGFDEFLEKHAGSNPEERSACHVCHTALPANVTAAQFPHQFTWQAR